MSRYLLNFRHMLLLHSYVYIKDFSQMYATFELFTFREDAHREYVEAILLLSLFVFVTLNSNQFLKRSPWLEQHPFSITIQRFVL